MVRHQSGGASEPNPFKQSLQQLCKRLKGAKFNVSVEQILYTLFQVLCSFQQMSVNAGTELTHTQAALDALNAGCLVRLPRQRHLSLCRTPCSYVAGPRPVQRMHG